MRVRKIIKDITFDESIRPVLIMSDDVRLNPDIRRLQLKLVGGSYTTLTNAYAITPIFNPDSVKRWVGFDVHAVHEYDDDGNAITSLQYRLSNEREQYVHDGTEWVVDCFGWNTEEEVSANISSFPMDTKKIKVIVNLLTTDSRYTPLVEKIKLLYNSNIEFQEDLIARTIIPAFRNNVRPISELVILVEEATDTIALNDFPMDTSYELVSIDSVFDHGSDPDHFTDILLSYDAETKTIQLSREVEADSNVWVNFLYRPLVAVSTDTEFSEDAKVPAIHITDVDTLRTIESFQGDTVRSKGTNTAIKIPSVEQKDISFSVRILTSLAKDLHRLADEIRAFFKNNRMITSKGMDEKYPLSVLTDFNIKTGIDEKTLHSGFFRFVVKRALFYQELEETAYVVTRFVIGGDMNVIIDWTEDMAVSATQIQYEASLNGSAVNAIGLFSKAPNAISNPSAYPVSDGENNYGDGQVDPFMAYEEQDILSVKFICAAAAVNQASVGATGTLRIDFFRILAGSETSLGVVRIPLDSMSTVGTQNDLSDVSALISGSFELTSPITLEAGWMFGWRFVNEDNDNTVINAISKAKVRVVGEYV